MSMTALGATWSVSASQPASENEAGYAALSYTEVNDVESLGAIGPTFEDVTFTPLKTGIAQHRKGGVDYGSLSVSMATNEDDAGQTLVAAGVDGANKNVVYSHKITLQDGAVRYFQGQIFSNPENVGTASDIIKNEVNVMLSTGIVKVAAP